MKKITNILCALILCMASCLVSFGKPVANFSHLKNVASAEEVAAVSQSKNRTAEEQRESVLSSLSITQSGYSFSINDFIYQPSHLNSAENAYYLYVNTTITFNKTDDSEIKYSYGTKTGSTFISSDAGDLTGINKYFAISCETEEKIYQVELRKIWSPANNEHITDMFTFFIVLSPVDFEKSRPYTWTDKDNKELDAPASSVTYTNGLSLSMTNAGTEVSPIFVDFIYNGQFYSVYCVNGKFYNQVTGNEIVEDKLSFCAPGTYEIYVYDKTCAKALTKKTIKFDNQNSTEIFSYSANSQIPSKNVYQYKFSVSNNEYTRSNMYLLATAADNPNQILVSKQIVNSDVTLRFYNLDTSTVGEILIQKYHTTISGTKNDTDEKLFPTTYSKISQLENMNLTFTDDSIYLITIKDKSQEPQTLYTFEFTILKDIHSSYDGQGSSGLEVNKIFDCPKEKIIKTEYDGVHELQDGQEIALQSSTTNNYIVKLANKSCSIEGIMDGATTYDNVTITVYGVGNISTNVYRDGSLVSSKVLTSGDSFLQKDAGDYKIVTTDEMGTVTVKNFTIKQELNTSTIILIGVGCITLVLFAIMIFRTRTKLKVR